MVFANLLAIALLLIVQGLFRRDCRPAEASNSDAMALMFCRRQWKGEFVLGLRDVVTVVWEWWVVGSLVIAV
jgi:hypothetical protein